MRHSEAGLLHLAKDQVAASSIDLAVDRGLPRPSLPSVRLFLLYSPPVDMDSAALEKSGKSERQATVEIDERTEKASYREGVGVGDLQVFRLSDGEDLKLAKDGVTVLIPQPSDDPNVSLECI